MLPQKGTKSTKDKSKLRLELILCAFCAFLSLITISEDSGWESESGSALAHSATVPVAGCRSDSDSVRDSDSVQDSTPGSGSQSVSAMDSESASWLTDLILPFQPPLASSSFPRSPRSSTS